MCGKSVFANEINSVQFHKVPEDYCWRSFVFLSLPFLDGPLFNFHKQNSIEELRVHERIFDIELWPTIGANQALLAGIT